MSRLLDTQSRFGLDDTPCNLHLHGIEKRYDGFCLGPLSLDVPEDSIVGLIGQNGAGKTTLMKCVLGAVHLDGGEVELFGQRISSPDAPELLAAKERMGFVSAVTSYPGGMSVQEVARTYELAYPRFRRDEFDRLAQAMELDAARNKNVKELSRGMGMKLQLACVLASGVSLLVMDEPTAGLDPIAREEVLGILRMWMEPGGRSVLISSHITSDLGNLADRIALIDKGQLLLNCTRDTIETMGVARLRASELELVRAGSVAADMPALKRDLSFDLLVPDRTAFKRAYPDCVCDPASIDDVMLLLVKGEVS